MCMKIAFLAGIIGMAFLYAAHFFSWYAIFVGQGNFKFSLTEHDQQANGTLAVFAWTKVKLHEFNATSGDNKYIHFVPQFASSVQKLSYSDVNLTHTNEMMTQSLSTLVVASIATTIMIPFLLILSCLCDCCIPRVKMVKALVIICSLIGVGGAIAAFSITSRAPSRFKNDSFCGNSIFNLESNNYTTGYNFIWDYKNPLNMTIEKGEGSYWCGSLIGSNTTTDTVVAWSPLIGFWFAVAAVPPLLLVAVLVIFCSGKLGPV
eukprot:TRINITY_DN6979_c0_g1_i1.p1 TRINITY_DN6979_c0_g1~~TRINITY_DN6979_c0_g1_i1.p1  ORF type:complete len:273 (+),score=36.55 TRINITY_DN6979_c0_g1_i1:35-820(+)